MFPTAWVTAFRIRPVEVSYTIGRKPASRTRRGELLISNFRWPAGGQKCT